VPRELVNGVELAVRQSGEGRPALCIHETAAAGRVWAPFAEAASGMRVIRYDRRGWGESEAPEGYRRTTVTEQAEDAAVLIERLAGEPAVICGAGLGAVAALDLALRRPDICAEAILIEPPLLAFLSEATEGLSADRAAIEGAVRDGGAAAAIDLYVGGGLPYLGAGAGRLPSAVAEEGRERPLSLFAELAAVAEWEIRPVALLECEVPVRIVIAASTPPVLRRAAEELDARLGLARALRLGGEGLPHVTAAPELAQALAGTASGA
jgi:pimeloyl-ACP methyl ester carboxylesterase